MVWSKTIRAIFFERTFIDVFCIKVSSILITNCVLNKNLKLLEHFDQTAIFDIFPNLLPLPFAFVSIQLGVQTNLDNKIMILCYYKYKKFSILIKISHFFCSIPHVNANKWLWEKSNNGRNLAFSAKMASTSKSDYRQKNFP